MHTHGYIEIILSFRRDAVGKDLEHQDLYKCLYRALCTVSGCQRSSVTSSPHSEGWATPRTDHTFLSKAGPGIWKPRVDFPNIQMGFPAPGWVWPSSSVVLMTVCRPNPGIGGHGEAVLGWPHLEFESNVHLYFLL